MIMKFEDMIGKVIQGDCLDVMRDIPDKSIDLILTDPPYGINVINGGKSFGSIGGGKPFGSIGGGNLVDVKKYAPIINDDIKVDLTEIFRISKNQVIFGGNYFDLPISKGWIVWDKKCKNNWADNFSDGELAWTSFDRPLKIYRHLWMGLIQEGKTENKYHPTQKPLQLIEYIVREYSKETDLILDPFLGSGTTAVACERLNRRWIGIEIEPSYVKTARERIKQEQDQIKLNI